MKRKTLVIRFRQYTITQANYISAPLNFTIIETTRSFEGRDQLAAEMKMDAWLTKVTSCGYFLYGNTMIPTGNIVEFSHSLSDV